jgi:hypothetical protein
MTDARGRLYQMHFDGKIINNEVFLFKNPVKSPIAGEHKSKMIF